MSNRTIIEDLKKWRDLPFTSSGPEWEIFRDGPFTDAIEALEIEEEDDTNSPDRKKARS